MAEATGLPKPKLSTPKGEASESPPPPVKITFPGAVGTMSCCIKIVSLSGDKNVRVKTKATTLVTMWNGTKPKVIASGGFKGKATEVPREPIVVGDRVFPASNFFFSDYVILSDSVGSDLEKIFYVTISIKDYLKTLSKEVMILGSGFPDSLKGFVNEELYYFLDYEDGVGIKGYAFAVRKSRTANIFVGNDQPKKLTLLLGEAPEFIPQMEPVTPAKKVEGMVNCNLCGKEFHEGEDDKGFCPCDEVAYCSQKHLDKDWSSHKKVCKWYKRK